MHFGRIKSPENAVVAASVVSLYVLNHMRKFQAAEKKKRYYSATWVSEETKVLTQLLKQDWMSQSPTVAVGRGGSGGGNCPLAPAEGAAPGEGVIF